APAQNLCGLPLLLPEPDTPFLPETFSPLFHERAPAAADHEGSLRFCKALYPEKHLLLSDAGPSRPPDPPPPCSGPGYGPGDSLHHRVFHTTGGKSLCTFWHSPGYGQGLSDHQRPSGPLHLLSLLFLSSWRQRLPEVPGCPDSPVLS